MTLSDKAGHIPANTTGLLDGYPDVDAPSCQLLGPTALVVQGLMGLLVIGSLVYKRHREKPMRPWRIWLFDVSKQVFGQMFVHGLNVLISGVISDVTSGNACVSYFLNILIDTTLGVAIIYGVLHGLNFLLSEKLGLKGFESGVYGTPPSLNYWCRQAAIYIVALTAMKVAVILLLVLFPGIFKIGEWLLGWTWTGNGDHLQVVFVMGIFPIVMNILQFWLIDSIVKASSGPVALEADVEDTAHPDREPLFNASSDDEDDNHRGRPGDIENQLGARQSHSSFESGHDSRAKSFATGITTPDDDEHKSINTSASGQPHERHAYPPSLSSSMTSTSSSSSNPLKESKKLAKHHSLRNKQASNPGSRSHSPSRGAKTLPDLPAAHSKPIVSTQTDEWAVSWDDDGEDGWDSRVPPIESKVPGQEFGDSVPQQRTRRLS